MYDLSVWCAVVCFNCSWKIFLICFFQMWQNVDLKYVKSVLLPVSLKYTSKSVCCRWKWIAEGIYSVKICRFEWINSPFPPELRIAKATDDKTSTMDCQKHSEVLRWFCQETLSVAVTTMLWKPAFLHDMNSICENIEKTCESHHIVTDILT